MCVSAKCGTMNMKSLCEEPEVTSRHVVHRLPRKTNRQLILSLIVSFHILSLSEIDHTSRTSQLSRVALIFTSTCV